MRRNYRRINRSFRTVVEQLEGRMLLSVWDGTWHVQGTRLDAQDGANGGFTHKPMAPTARITSSDIPGQYTLTVSGVGDKTETMVLTGDDTLIQRSSSDDSSDSYLKLYMIDPGVIEVVNGSIDYTDSSKQVVSHVNFFAGIATQKAAPTVQFAWDGPYHVQSVGLTFGQGDQNPGIQWTTESQDILATPAGAGKYNFAPAGQSGGSDQPLYSPSGKMLVASYSGPTAWDPNTREQKYEQIVRGPYGRVYHIGGDAEFDTNSGQLRSAWFDASFTDPHVNVAPTLNPAGSPTLTTINEDEVDSSGTSVSDLLSSAGSNYIYDPNTGDTQGIAVVKMDTKHGTWQYSTDGSTWQDAGKVNASSALLLAPDAKLRFIPKADFFGSLPKAITFRAWDQSDNPTSVNASAGTTPFSKALDTASLEVKAINDAPVITGNSVALTCKAGAKPIAVFNGMKLTDVDSPLITSAQVTFSGGYLPGTDTITYKGPKTITASINAAAGTIDLTSASPMKLSAFVSALKGITFGASAAHDDVVITFEVVDKDAFGSLNQQVSVDRILHVIA